MVLTGDTASSRVAGWAVTSFYGPTGGLGGKAGNSMIHAYPGHLDLFEDFEVLVLSTVPCQW